MPGSLTHTFVSTHAENNSSGGISANEWNATHTITGTFDSSQITSVTASQVTGLIAGTQIATVGSSQLTGSVLSSQVGTVGTSQVTLTASGLAFTSSYVASILSSQVTLGIAFGSSFITTYPTSQLTVGASNLALTSSFIQTIGTSQITASASNLALTSSYIQTIGSSQISTTLPSSQGGTGVTTLGSQGNLLYDNSSIVGGANSPWAIWSSAFGTLAVGSSIAIQIAGNGNAFSNGFQAFGSSAMSYDFVAVGYNISGVSSLSSAGAPAQMALIRTDSSQPTVGVLPISSANTQIAFFDFSVANSSGYFACATIRVSGDPTFLSSQVTNSSATIPAYMELMTSNNLAQSLPRMRIDSLGLVTLRSSTAGNNVATGNVNTVVFLETHAGLGGL